MRRFRSEASVSAAASPTVEARRGALGWARWRRLEDASAKPSASTRRLLAQQSRSSPTAIISRSRWTVPAETGILAAAGTCGSSIPRTEAKASPLEIKGYPIVVLQPRRKVLAVSVDNNLQLCDAVTPKRTGSRSRTSTAPCFDRLLSPVRKAARNRTFLSWSCSGGPRRTGLDPARGCPGLCRGLRRSDGKLLAYHPAGFLDDATVAGATDAGSTYVRTGGPAIPDVRSNSTLLQPACFSPSGDR